MAVYSMTGFGQGRAQNESLELAVEIKTVNHRFLDISAKLPGAYASFEAELAKLVRSNLRRGRVDVYVSRTRLDQAGQTVQFNSALFAAYLREVGSALRRHVGSEAFPMEQVLAAFLTRREVLDVVSVEQDSSAEKPLLLSAASDALAAALEMRRVEGAELENELLSLLSEAEKLAGAIKKSVAGTPEAVQQRLTARLEKLLAGAELDAERLAQEVAYLADRADVTEEITRLESHFGQFRAILKHAEGGRKLEFLLQEMGREVNTIGSKSQDAQVSGLVVDVKAVLEKLREQVQNIE